MTGRRANPPAPLVVPAPTLADGADRIAYLAQLWATFTGRDHASHTT